MVDSRRRTTVWLDDTDHGKAAEMCEAWGIESLVVTARVAVRVVSLISAPEEGLSEARVKRLIALGAGAHRTPLTLYPADDEAIQKIQAEWKKWGVRSESAAIRFAVRLVPWKELKVVLPEGVLKFLVEEVKCHE